MSGLTDSERDRYRLTQDIWLTLPPVAYQIKNYGEYHSIAHTGSPTFHDVRTRLLPNWREWFLDFIHDYIESDGSHDGHKNQGNTDETEAEEINQAVNPAG